jgi:hypothetical protein
MDLLPAGLEPVGAALLPGEDGSRLSVSAGLRVATAAEMAVGYEAGAVLPREPWRPMTRAERDRVLCTDPDPARDVAVVRLPPGSLARIRACGEPVEVLSDLRSVCRLDGSLDVLGAGSNPPGRQTVTIAPETGRSIGMHLDSWDNLPLEARGLSSNRICVNIGRESRFFLFVPVSLMDMPALLAERLGPEEPPADTPLHRLFMAMFPEIPVLRCRVDPGEAYVAPTECLVHDGSSLGQTGLDEQFTVRGFITALPR